MVKFISLHVTGFGKLQDFDLRFSDGITEVAAPNGFGKTTVAAFIKAMLYGLPVLRKTDIAENERAKYEPWQGGRYGGTLTFEASYGSYRIERYFGQKAKDDECKVIDLSSETVTDRFGDDIGLALFGVDAESFKRSTFLPQQRPGQCMTEGLNAKLTGLVESGDEPERFEKAEKLLDARASYLLKRGNKGRIPDLERNIAELSRRIDESRQAAENMKMLEERRAAMLAGKRQISGEISSVREQQRIADAAEASRLRSERRAELYETLEAAASKKSAVLAKYPNGLPQKIEITTAEQDVLAIRSCEKEIEILTSASKNDLERLSGFFVPGVPSKDEIKDCRLSLTNAAAKRSEAAKLQTEASKISDPEQRHGYIAAIASIALTAVSCILFIILKNIIFGIAAGAAFVFAVVLFAVKHGQNAKAKRISEAKTDLQKKAETAISDALALETEAAAFTGKYIPDMPPLEAVEIIAENLMAYDTYRKSRTENSSRANNLQAQRTETSGRLKAFFEKYPAYSDQSFEIAVRRIYDDLNIYAAAEGDEAAAKQRIALLPEEEAGEGATAGSAADRDALLKKERELSERLTLTDSEIAELSSRISELVPVAGELAWLCEQLDGAKDELLHFKTMHEDITAAGELLTKAREALSGRYMSGVRSAFDRYIKEISGSKDRFLLGTDLSVSVSLPDGTRESGYLSTGANDMLDICMRLALADALYGEDKPPLILDDPFVNLDDEKLAASLQMLKRLSSQCQIVYLTCSSSRRTAEQ